MPRAPDRLRRRRNGADRSCRPAGSARTWWTGRADWAYWSRWTRWTSRTHGSAWTARPSWSRRTSWPDRAGWPRRAARPSRTGWAARSRRSAWTRWAGKSSRSHGCVRRLWRLHWTSPGGGRRQRQATRDRLLHQQQRADLAGGGVCAEWVSYVLRAHWDWRCDARHHDHERHARVVLLSDCSVVIPVTEGRGGPQRPVPNP